MPTPTDRPLRIAVTGSMGSGKSYVCHLLEQAGFPVFSCDAEARRLMSSDAALRQELAALAGRELYDGTGQMNKSVMRAFISASPTNAARVNALVHPRVADAFGEWVARQDTSRVFMECALLFESGFDRLADLTAVVVAPADVRLRRVMARDGLSRSEALRWMSAQLPDEEKRRRADIVVDNGGTAPPDIRQLVCAAAT